MKYSVARTCVKAEYIEVEAESEEEAINVAMYSDDDCWDVDGNSEVMNQWDYSAEEIDD